MRISASLIGPTRRVVVPAAAAVAAMGLLGSVAQAWEFKVLQTKLRDTAKTPMNGKPGSYTSLPNKGASKKWHLCMLAPHMTNNILRSYLYGTVQEAKRLGVKLTTFDAGGYKNLGKQLNQFDDCMAIGANAILLMAISPTAFAPKIRAARARGIKVIDLNIGVNAKVDGRVVVTYLEVGKIIGRALAKKHPKGSGKVQVVVMPGPAGVAWSEDTAKGFKEAIKGSDVVVAKVVYGSPSRLKQTPLVEDVLVTYKNLKYIVGMGTSLEAALNSLREQGRLGQIGLYGSFMTPSLVKAIKSKQVAGVVVENSLVINRLAVDMAVRLLEGKASILDAVPVVTLVDDKNVADVPKDNFVPKGWKVQMNVN